MIGLLEYPRHSCGCLRITKRCFAVFSSLDYISNKRYGMLLLRKVPKSILALLFRVALGGMSKRNCTSVDKYGLWSD